MSVSEGIHNLAQRMLTRKRQREDPYTLLLGAGASVDSGNPLSGQLCDGLCELLGTETKKELFQMLEGATRSSADFHTALESLLSGRKPSIGYNYLAHLIDRGYFNIIFTTNWDSLLEDTLPYQLSPGSFKVLICGETMTERLPELLDSRAPRVKILKLHGDLRSRVFDITDRDLFKVPPELVRALSKYLCKDVIIVGHSVNDPDIQQALRNTKGVIWHVSPQPPEENDFIARALGARGCDANLIRASFDVFFMNLALELERQKLEEEPSRYRKKPREIITQLEKGRNYLDVHNVRESVKQLCSRIRMAEFLPDLIAYVHDPDAPGGSEVWKWMRREKGFANVQAQRLRVSGRYERLANRAAQAFPNEDLHRDVRRVLLIDSIAFTGRTLLLAAEQIRKAYGDVTVKLGFVLVGRKFLRRLDGGEIEGFTRDDVFFVEKTDRTEIFFPWGYTESTADTNRELPTESGDYQVRCLRRPWGSTEIFAENQICTVKLLNVNAGHCLSLQRHLCRDEFFIPLDDNIGLQLENERFVIEKGDYIVIRRGMWHRIFAYKNSGRVLEIGLGYYDQIHDIERREDMYGREQTAGSK